MATHMIKALAAFALEVLAWQSQYLVTKTCQQSFAVKYKWIIIANDSFDDIDVLPHTFAMQFVVLGALIEVFAQVPGTFKHNSFCLAMSGRFLWFVYLCMPSLSALLTKHLLLACRMLEMFLSCIAQGAERVQIVQLFHATTLAQGLLAAIGNLFFRFRPQETENCCTEQIGWDKTHVHFLSILATCAQNLGCSDKATGPPMLGFLIASQYRHSDNYAVHW